MHKKALIITYYWPPAGGPGVQRWLKFLKYLPEFGIEPIVYIPQNPSYPIVDKSLISEVPKNLCIISHPIKEPYKLASFISGNTSKSISSGVIPKVKKQSTIEKLLLFVRGNFFIPDARKSWVEPSVDFLLEHIQKQGIQTIITTGPPHSLHLIGMELKERLGIRWLADFRDPWTTIGYHKALKLTKSSQRKHLQLEHDVLNSADVIIVTSENTKKEFTSKTNQPIEVITNGYDSYEVQKVSKDKKFSISHIGSLLSERNPKNLWLVLDELIKEHVEFRNDFQLKLIGLVSDDVLDDIKSAGLQPYINLMGYVSHSEALKLQRQSQVLLLIEIDSEDTKAIIPGKLYEYMISECPILALGPSDTDVERIIKSTNTGTYFYYDSKDHLKTQILHYFERYKSGLLLTQSIGLKAYSRKELTATLAKLI